ncbi:uncharacterized protein LOC144168917 isoform X2 [Haemaphysalis longicornis]
MPMISESNIDSASMTTLFKVNARDIADILLPSCTTGLPDSSWRSMRSWPAASMASLWFLVCEGLHRTSEATRHRLFKHLKFPQAYTQNATFYGRSTGSPILQAGITRGTKRTEMPCHKPRTSEGPITFGEKKPKWEIENPCNPLNTSIRAATKSSPMAAPPLRVSSVGPTTWAPAAAVGQPALLGAVLCKKTAHQFTCDCYQ